MKQKNWLDIVKKNPVSFGLEAGFEDLEEIHNEWIKKFLFSNEDITLQAHRGSYKTTCLSISIALMIILYPDENIIFIRKTDDDVKEVVTQVGKLLRTEMFKLLVYFLYNGMDLVIIKESAYEIDTNLKVSNKGASQLLGLGSKVSITGKHANIVITDDIVNIDDRISKASRNRTRYTYQELQNIKNRGGRIINTGTPWHKDDAFELMPNIIKYDCYETGLMDDDEIQELRDSMTPSLFAANYELKHISDKDAMFYNPNIDKGENTHLIYDGVCHIDASYGGSDGSAFTILKRQPDGKIFVYGALRQEHIDDCLPDFERKRKLYRAGTLFNETNADKGYLAKRIEKPVKTYHESMNKYVKIATYLRAEWENIVFIADTDKEYINQILDYTENAEHDDAPDSLASLLREGNKKVMIKTFKHGI